MTTTAVPPQTPIGRAPSPPSTPSPAAIARRGRRPALIPPTADLSSLFSTFSPSSSTYHASLTNVSGTAGFKPPLFVLPPPLPAGGENYGTGGPPKWRNASDDDVSPFGFGWSSDEEEGPRGLGKRKARWDLGNGMSIKRGSSNLKAELKRKLFGGHNVSHDDDAMEVDDNERGEVERDVFSWVNSTNSDNPHTSLLLPKSSNPTLQPSPLPQPQSSSHLQLPRGARNHRPIYLTATQEDDGGAGTYTVPTSPLSGSFGEEIEAQRKRLEDAGIDTSKMRVMGAMCGGRFVGIMDEVEMN